VSKLPPAPVTLVSVTGLLLVYGSTEWSWLAGPVAALAIWALDYEPHRPAETASTSVLPISVEPEPVD
jgi:hypothetical protein